MSAEVIDGDITTRTPFISGDVGDSVSGSGEGSENSSTMNSNTTTATKRTVGSGSAANNKIRSSDTASDDEPEERCEKPSLALMKLKTYLTALRPWSLSASLVPTFLGAAIAYRTSGIHEFSVVTLVLTIFTIISVHCAGNVVNTYFDYVKGIDNRKSDDRTLVDHILSKDEVSDRPETYFLCCRCSLT